MPDFDQNLNPIFTNISLPDMPSQLRPFEHPTMPDMSFDDFYKNYSIDGSPISKQKNIFDTLAQYENNSNNDVNSLVGTTHKTLKENQRYGSYHPDLDMEDMYGQGQGIISKATHGVLKGLNLAGTTILSTGAMIGGVGKAISSGRIADIWDNEATRAMDAWNVKVDQEYLPNYYTNKETNANWYSTDNWMTWNFLFDKAVKNSGFMVGAIVTDRLMFSALGKAGSIIGEAAAAGEKAIQAKAAARAVASGTIESAEAYQKSKIIAPLLNKIARGFSQGKNIEVANELEKGISSIADLEARKSALEVINASRNSFAEFNLKARKMITSLYSSSGESMFEALNTTTEHRNNLIQQYQDTHGGMAPIGADLDEINTNADYVGKTSFLANMAVLSITEYAQLPNLLGHSYNVEKQLANSLMGEVGETVLENGIHVAKPLTKFNKIFNSAKRVGSYVFDPKEGAQEILQTGVQVGTQNYFNKKYQTNDADVLVDGFIYGLVGKDKAGKDVGALVSKEGLEGGLLGGLTGGVGQVRSTYNSYKQKDSSTKEFLNQINTAPTFKEAFKDKIDFANRGVILQQQKQDAVVQGDKLEAKDLLTDSTLNYLAPRVKYGRVDMVMADITDMRELSATAEGLATLKESGHASQEDTASSFNLKLNEFESTTKAVETLYNSLNSRYAGEVLRDKEGVIIKDANGKPQRKYSPEVIDKMVYAASKVTDYDKRIPLLNNSLAKANINTLEVLDSIINNGKPNIEATDKALSDINKSNVVDKDKLKQNLSDVIELNLRRNQFLEEYESIKTNPLNYTTAEDVKQDREATIEQQELQKDRRKKPLISEKELIVGKEYSLKENLRKEGTSLHLAPKITILGTTLGGEFEVKLPNGKTTFITPTEFKNYNISDEDNTSKEMENIFDEAIDDVLNRKEYAHYKEALKAGKPEDILDKRAFINDLDNQKLIDDVEKEFHLKTKDLIAQRIKEKESKEKLKKQKEDLDRQQAKIELVSGEVESIPTDATEYVGSEDKRKDVDIVFLAGTSPSKKTVGEAKYTLPHAVRARNFLSGFKFFKNKDKIKEIIVTPNNVKELGLEGLIQLSLGKQLTDELTEEDVDVDMGFMAKVFIVQSKEENFFANEKGEKISKIGDINPTILNDVVFQTMTTASLQTSGGYEKIRAGQEEEALKALEAYKIFRRDRFAENGYTPYSFGISRGIPERNKINGEYENNPISDVLGDKGEQIIANEQVLHVITTGKHEHNGELLTFTPGTTIIQYGDLLDYANNRKVTKTQANNIYAVIEATANELVKDGKAKINFNYANFLQNVLYWKSNSKTTTPSQVSIDTSNQSFNIGDQSFSLLAISENKEAILNALQDAFISVNNKTLSEGVSKNFTEYVVDSEGNLKPVTWKNYQSYLLSAKNPDGTKRNTSEIPVITHTSKPTQTTPSYDRKYSYIIDKGILPYDRVVKKEIKEEILTIKNNTFSVSIPNFGKVNYIINQNNEYIINEIDEEYTNTAKNIFEAINTDKKAKSLEEVTTEEVGGQIKRTIDSFVKKDVDIKNASKKQEAEIKTITIPKIGTLSFIVNNGNPEFIENEELEKAREMFFNASKKTNPNLTDEESNQNTLNALTQLANKQLESSTQETKTSATIEKEATTTLEGEKERINKEWQEELNKLSENKNLNYNRIGYIYDRQKVNYSPLLKKAIGDGRYLREETIATIMSRYNNYFEIKLNNFLKKFNFNNFKDAENEIKSGKYLENKNKAFEKYRKYDRHFNDEQNERIHGVTEEELFATSLYASFESLKKEFDFKNNPKNYLKLAVFNNKSISNPQEINEDDYNQINIKYTKQLADLENKEKASNIETEEVEKKETSQQPFDPSKIKRGTRGGAEFRQKGNDSTERMTNSDIEAFKQWHARNVPGIPFEILNKIIERGDIRAWGVFENGVAKFVKGGLKGTEYHEVFEAIWAEFLSEKEKNDILTEFKNKEGEFIDRQSGKKILHSEATDAVAKERIADDFADFRLGKITARTLGQSVRDFFKRIMDFFKSFVTKPSLKEEMFKAIDKGKFKEYKIQSKVISPQYRIQGLTEQQTNGYIQDMVFQVSRIIFREGSKDSLFNPEKLTGTEVFDQIKEQYTLSGDLDALGQERYESLVKKAIQSIRTIGISFNEDEVISINDDNASSREYAKDTFSVDWKKHSTGALNFLLSTLAERKALNQTNLDKLTPLKPAEYDLSEQGYKLLNFNRVFSTLLDRLHNTNDPEEFANKFVQLAKEDSNYLSLFITLGGNPKTHSFDFNEFGDSDWKLFIQFFNTFTRQKPDALIQYTSSEGDVHTGAANIFTSVRKTIDSWVNNMKVIGKSEDGVISYDKTKKVYTINTKEILKLSIKKPTDMLNFLSSIGVEFPIGTYDGLSNKEYVVKGKKTTEIKQFIDAVGTIQTQLGKNNELMTFDAKRLDINEALRTLSTLYNKVNNPNQDSTYFGVEGQRIGAFSENNAPSYFENTFNESKTIKELLEKMPQLNDVYSRGSEILKLGGLFFNEDGDRIATIKVGYIQGSKNDSNKKNKATSDLTKGERFIQEMNQNINGNYYVLIPGDSSTEWMMNLGNVISMEDVIAEKHWDKVYSIYNNYLNDDINLALDNRTHNTYTKGKSQELRILRDVLSEDVVKDIEEMIKNNTSYDDIQSYIIKNKEKINNSIKEFIENISNDTFNTLLNANEIITIDENEYIIPGINTDFLKKYNLKSGGTKEEILNIINFVNINYTINNQEYHKILFGDPYQFKTAKGKLDETKRIKSFLSGRRRTFDMQEYNDYLKRTYNNVDGFELEEGTPGYHEYKPYTTTVTFNDVNIIGSIATLSSISQEIKEAYSDDEKGNPKVNETDAFSILMDNTYKEIKLKEGQWSDSAEEFHQWQMAYTRNKLYEYKENEQALKKHDAELILTKIPKHKIFIGKPIISGNKHNKTELDIVLDKTSQMPLYYHMIEGTSLGEMYKQMFNQKIGYGIVISGRKAGSQGVHEIYVDGKVNTAEFQNTVEVPWKIYGTQVETASEGEKTQTRGSQPTKVATMDLFENGEPIGDTLERKQIIKEAVERHDRALNMLNENGYNELLNKLGVTDLGNTFALEDKTKISETLMYEMMRRELSENAIDTITLNEDGDFPLPFEASPSYIQIKNILYSLVNKALISPAMHGSPHVQAPVTMWENSKKGRSFARKVNNQWVKITKEQYNSLSDEEKKSVALTDDTLKFYEDAEGKRHCEILLPHWFKGKFGNMTDEQILEYLDTVEGKKILTGIGFRIPTQSLSSIEIFKVKGFLPQYMGYTVIVPSEITTKAGSDFDIDKLNMYLKSVYTDKNGNVKLIKWLGSEAETKAFFSRIYNETILKDIQKIKDSDAFREELYNFLDPTRVVSEVEAIRQQIFYDQNEAIINEIISQADAADKDPVDYINDQIQMLAGKEAKLNAKLLNDTLRNKYVNEIYKYALQNEYYECIEELVTLPENFIKLISPIDDAGLEELSELLDKKRGYNESTIKGRLINRNFMTNMRHGFITGKKWVGIAAVNITNLSLRQKGKVYLDPTKLTSLPKEERKFIKNLDVILPHNTIDVNGQKRISLSGTKTFDNTQAISQRLSGYATAFVDIANKPFITKIIKSDVVVSTFMFLEAIGAGNTGIYFLNQPIIEKYLEYLDSINSKSVANDKNLQYIQSLFPTTQEAFNKTQISVEQLLDNIEEYGKNKKFDANKNAEQHLILEEFVKYKIMADHFFSYTQSTNYDTTKFGSSDALLKKEWATFNASNFNLIANVNDVMNNTFIGKQAELLSKAFASFGPIMKTEQPEIKAFTISTLKKYATKKYMSSEDYEKIANLIKNSFIDYVIQNNTIISNMIKPLLVEGEVVNQLEQAKQKYPSIQILKDLVPVLGNRENSAKSIELIANVKDAYSENLYTNMMRELRDANPELNSLYNNIVNLAILQGTAQSAISIRNIIPVEDYGGKIAPIIDNLQPTNTLEAFSNGMFERNNFSNPEIFKEYTPYAKESPQSEYEEEMSYSFPAFRGIKEAKAESKKLIVLNDQFNSFQISSDFIKIPKIIKAKGGVNINLSTGYEITKRDFALMLQKGSQELFKTYYYKKVYTKNKDEFGTDIPLRTPKVNKETGNISYDYYYKLINVYGDGNRAVEYNTNFTPSVIDNGSVTVDEELLDDDIINAFYSKIEEEDVSLPAKSFTENTNDNNINKIMKENNLDVNEDITQEDLNELDNPCNL